MEPVATVAVDPASALVYPEGWQSWSHTGTFPVQVPPRPATSPESLTINGQYGQAAPAGVFRGSGLLAVDVSGSGPVEVFVAADVSGRVPVLEAVLRGSALVVSADAPVRQHADDGPGGIQGALGRWAGSLAAGSLAAGSVAAPVAGRPLRAIPPVWCSWYQYYSGVTQADVLWNLALMDTLSLPVEIVQVDDGYEACVGDWLLSSGRFSDLAGLIGRIRACGRRAGIWIAPMLAGRSSALFAAHPDWVVRGLADDEPVYAGTVCRDSCTALDLTHPGAAGYLRDVLATLRGWGVDYFKIDFCYAGAIEGRRHEQLTGVEAYRQGLRLIRDAIGPDALLTGCGAPILPSVGMVDAMRIGPDIAADYEPACGNPTLPAQRNAARNVIARAWQHGRFWVNDPDCLMLRPQVQRRSDWLDVVERYGGLRASGDGLGQLDDWGLAATRRLLIPSPTDPVV
jgi:alpha-galactosidase